MPRSTRTSTNENQPLIDRLADRLLGDGGLRRASRIASWTFLVGGIAFVLAYFVPGLLQERGQRAAATPGRLVLETPTDWFGNSPELAGRLERLVFQHAGTNPTNRQGLVHAHDALQSSGWFTSIDRLERKADGSILVRGSLAQPFAVVRWGNWDHLVDLEGRLLDWPFKAGQASPLLPVITGAQTPPPADERGRRAFGSHWAGSAREIEAGLALARAIHGRDWEAEVRTIDVTTYLDDRCLWLTTGRGPRIRWGLAPDEMSASELTSNDKIRALDKIHATYGPLESLQRSTLDIRHDVSTRTRMVSE
ncbi:MAG: hypothetical protein P8J45_11345 [Phycisphaerales bacterium]|jgi:hypothetical protein|nr:hypothetical protein [Phycisphaerales bacterium]